MFNKISAKKVVFAHKFQKKAMISRVDLPIFTCSAMKQIIILIDSQRSDINYVMFIRQTKTGSSADGKVYYTFRLVASKRIGNKVRQQTLLNLGRHFSLPREQWGQLCSRIDDIISGQLTLEVPPEETEQIAQRYAARLIANRSECRENDNTPDYQEVDVASLELIRPRSIGVKHVGLEAIKCNFSKSQGNEQKSLDNIDALYYENNA